MTYEFTNTIQEKILGLLWRDPDCYSLYSSCVKPKYFESSIHIDIAREVYKYWEEYKSPPTPEALEDICVNKICTTKNKKLILKEYIATVQRCSEVELSDSGYLRDKIIEFGRRQAMTEAILESAEIIKSGGQYSSIEDMVKKALLVGTELEDLGSFITENIEERFETYETGEEVIERIPTNMELLNKTLRGGLGRGEMGVIIAPPGRGKTTFLINMGASALREGYNVTHYSLENSEKVITRNYDQRILEKDMVYLKENATKSIKAIKKMTSILKGNLLIKRMITKRTTVQDIRAHIINGIKLKGFKPDVLIVDYGAILGSNKRFSEKRHIVTDIYEELRGLAIEFDCAIWTAIQTNRGGLSKKIISMADIAEAFEVAATADVMIALCQTIKEKKANQMRYFFTKVRDSSDSMVYKGKVDHNTKLMTMDKEVVEKIEDEADFEE